MGRGRGWDEGRKMDGKRRIEQKNRRTEEEGRGRGKEDRRRV